MFDPSLISHASHSEIGRTILKVVYDYDTKAENDPLVTLADASMYHLVVGTQPGRYFVDYWPLLKYIPAWFPGAWFKRFALEGAALNAEMRDSVFKTVKEEMASLPTSVLTIPEASQ